MRFIVQLCRILVGGLFIFSGLIKANDPVGFGVKLEDYFLVFGEALPFFSSDLMLGLTLPLAWLVVVFEVVCGVALLLGMKRKLIAFSLLAMMIFFTWLTGYSAVTGAVTDCGCFGDAIPLTPWQSFQKDIILTILILVICVDVFIWPKAIRPILPSGIRTFLFIAATVFSGWVGIRAITHLPFLDFRAYKVGVNLLEGMELPEGAKQEIREITWTYKNKSTGELKEFVGDPPADYETWEYVDRVDKVIQEADLPAIHDFILNDLNGEDVTARILAMEDVNFYAISPELTKTRSKGWERFIAIQQAAEAEGIQSFGLVGATPEEIENFRHEQQAAFPFYSVDMKTLKTIIRTDPGIILVQNATILAKWSWRELPDFEKIKSEHFPNRETRDLQPDAPAELFSVGQRIPELIAEGAPDISEFFLSGPEGGDVTEAMLTDTAWWVIVRDVFEVSQESWTSSTLPLLQALDESGLDYAVLTGSAEDEFQPMRGASGLDFDYYFSDAELLEKIGPANEALLRMEGGLVDAKWAEGPMPSLAEILAESGIENP